VICFQYFSQTGLDREAAKSLIPEILAETIWNIFRSGSPEAGAAECLTEVFPFHLDDAAHLVETGTHALPNAVAEALRARCRS
jgi:hypothetical protein